jgi:hypothetical protein
VEKAKAFIYIYTNSRLLHQRPDDNIFSEDSDDDSGALSKTDDNDNDDNDDNNGNRGKGHSGGGEHRGADPPIIPRNLHPEAVYD